MTNLSTRTFVLLCVAGTVCIGLLMSGQGRWLSWQTDVAEQKHPVNSRQDTARQFSIRIDQPAPEPEMVSGQFWQNVDGAWKQIDEIPRSIKEAQETRDRSRDRLRRIVPVSNVGRSPLLDPELNENVKSIAQTVKTNQHPERLSAMMAPTPFNRERFVANPKAYLDTFEPGRVFQNLPAGSDAPRIMEEGRQYHELLQGETAVLKARAGKNMPVTFYSPNLGQFDNRLPAITVQADENGLATARFTASPGTRDYIDIIAGSPTRRGQAKYLVRVILPDVAQ